MNFYKADIAFFINKIKLQEFVEEQSNRIDKDKIGKVEIKEMKATDDGGYTVSD